MITPAGPALWIAWAVSLALAALLFTVWPAIDLAVSQWAYGSDQRFASTISGLTGALRQAGPDSLLALFGALLLWAAVGRWVRLPDLLNRGQAIYVTLCLLLGPGLIVNAGLKSFWGRARPSQIDVFGGTAQFTPALQLADQCASNCAFVSGDAALGFCLTALAFVWRRHAPALFAVGLSVGLLFGASRIAQGGHFLSDIVFAGLIVIGLNMALAHWMASDKAGEYGA